VIDHRGRIEEFNAAARQVFGFASQDVLGCNEHPDAATRMTSTTATWRYLAPARSTSSASAARYRATEGRLGVSTYLSVGEMVIDGEKSSDSARPHGVQLESQLRERAR
jgi:hypothetical protein